jgi:hypothetical protein
MVLKHRHILHGAAPLVLAFAAGLAITPNANADDIDPPARVGRIALIQGTVSFHVSPDDQWTPATLNYPVAQSTAIWADNGGMAEVGLGEARIRLAAGTELDVVQLDDQNVILSVPQGRVDIALHGMTDGERYDIQTPRGDVDLLADGSYRVIAGTDTDPTRVASFTGQAQLVGASSSITVATNQEMVATPGAQVSYSVSSTTQDDFDNSFFQAVAMVYAHPAPAYVPPAPGVEELAAYGNWQDDPRYGHVWTPRQVEAGWQPYRRGHWGFVPPWGYTWIDDAPWGFAPFHYGRWVSVRGSWAWVPVERGVVVDRGYRPVYAPAMVTFIGNPAALTVGIAGVGASVGWVPLGPGEPWRPWYPHSDNYLRQANIANVNRTVITNITNTTVINNVTYINQRAAVVVPQAAFAGGRPVAEAAIHIQPEALTRPIEAARAATITKVLPPPVLVQAAARQAVLPPAPKLQMAHPAAASAAVFHAHPPPANAAPQSAIPKAGSNVVPKDTVIPPAARPLAARPAAEVKPETQPAEQGKPGTAQPGAAAGRPEEQKPEAVRPGEAAHPGAATPALHPAEAPKPGEPARPGEAAHPGPATPALHPAEAPKPGEPVRPGEAAHPGAATPALHPAEAPKPGEPARPGEASRPGPATPALHPAEAPKPGEPVRSGEAAHPGPATPALHPAEAPKPGEPAKPGEASHPGPATPALHPAEASRPGSATPALHPAEAPKPEPAKPGEPAHPTTAAPAPRPQAEAPKPAPHPAEAAKAAPRPEVEAAKPAPHPAAAEPAGHKLGEPPAKEEPKKPNE